MAINIACECGKSLTVGDEFVGRRAKCPICNREFTLPKGLEAVVTVAKTFVYKMVQIPPNIEVAQGTAIGQKAAAYLERVVNDQARAGWEFYRIDPIGVSFRRAASVSSSDRPPRTSSFTLSLSDAARTHLKNLPEMPPRRIGLRPSGLLNKKPNTIAGLHKNQRIDSSKRGSRNSPSRAGRSLPS